MELVERAHIQKLNLLCKLTQNEYIKVYKQYIKSNNRKLIKKEDMIICYNDFKKYIECFIKCKGERQHFYNRPRGFGRLVCGTSIQTKNKFIRGFLFNGETTIIDIENAQPKILEIICNQHNIECCNLTLYNNNRNKFLVNNKITKHAIISALFDKKTHRAKTQELKNLYNEIYNIRDKIYELYNNKIDFTKYIGHLKEDNEQGSLLSLILQDKEDLIMNEIIGYLIFNNYEISVLLFDGLMIYGNYYEDEELLKNINKKIQEKYDIKIKYEAHDTTITQEYLDDLDEVIVITDDNVEMEFSKQSEIFEKNHLKIINNGLYIRELENGKKELISETQLLHSYKHKVCLVNKMIMGEKKLVEVSFINEWVNCNPTIRQYDNMGVYPNKLKCPPNTYNLWEEFKMENVRKYTPMNDNLQFLLNHLKILCDDNMELYNYLICWTAQLIQHPETKTNMPIMTSRQGAGKGTYLKMLRAMLGDNKIYETTDPDKYIFGQFNGHLTNSLVIVINEAEYKLTSKNDSNIKAIITDPPITINEKNVSMYVIDWSGRLIGFSNSHNSFGTSTDDRRKWFIRCSNKLCNNYRYYNIINGLIEDVDTMKTLYEYFKNYKYGDMSMDKFNSIKKPISDAQRELCESSEKVPETFIKNLSMEKIEEDIECEEFTNKTIYQEFKLYLSNNSLEYKTNGIRLMAMLLELDLPREAITRGKAIHKRTGDYRTINFRLIREYYNQTEEDKATLEI